MAGMRSAEARAVPVEETLGRPDRRPDQERLDAPETFAIVADGSVEDPVPMADARLAPVARLGWIVLTVFFGVFGGWALWAPLAGAVVASGWVKVDGNRHTVQHPDGGLVAEVAVREGDRVAAGDLLLRLDPAEAIAERDVLRQRLVALRLSEARLLAELSGRPAPILPADAGSGPDIAPLWNAEVSQFESRRRALAGQRAVIDEKIGQLDAQRQGADAQLAGRRRQLASLVAERDAVAPLVAQGVATRPRLAGVERSIAETEGEIGRLANDSARAAQAIDEQRRISRQIGLDDLSDAARDLRAVQASLVEVVPRLAGAEAKLARTEIRARTAARVVGMTVFAPGNVVTKGEKILDLLPDRQALVVEARLPVDQMADVTPGMAATVHLTALKDHVTPVVDGTVARVSADRLLDERSGRPYVAVEVRLPPAGPSSADAARLVPGMPVTLMVPTRSRTLLTYLMDPLTAAVRTALREK